MLKINVDDVYTAGSAPIPGMACTLPGTLVSPNSPLTFPLAEFQVNNGSGTVRAYALLKRGTSGAYSVLFKKNGVQVGASQSVNISASAAAQYFYQDITVNKGDTISVNASVASGGYEIYARFACLASQSDNGVLPYYFP